MPFTNAIVEGHYLVRVKPDDPNNMLIATAVCNAQHEVIITMFNPSSADPVTIGDSNTSVMLIYENVL